MFSVPTIVLAVVQVDKIFDYIKATKLYKLGRRKAKSMQNSRLYSSKGKQSLAIYFSEQVRKDFF